MVPVLPAPVCPASRGWERSSEPGPKTQHRGDSKDHRPPPKPRPSPPAGSRCPSSDFHPRFLLRSGFCCLTLPPGAPVRMAFIKSLWELEILDQTSWGAAFSCLDMPQRETLSVGWGRDRLLVLSKGPREGAHALLAAPGPARPPPRLPSAPAPGIPAPPTLPDKFSVHSCCHQPE